MAPNQQPILSQFACALLLIMEMLNPGKQRFDVEGKFLFDISVGLGVRLGCEKRVQAGKHLLINPTLAVHRKSQHRSS